MLCEPFKLNFSRRTKGEKDMDKSLPAVTFYGHGHESSHIYSS